MTENGANPAEQIRVSTDVMQRLAVEGSSMLLANFTHPWSHSWGRHGVREASDATGDRRVTDCALGASSSDVGVSEDGEDWLDDGDLDLRTLISGSS